jgi:2-succinyl-5-enolpyruvyl-6-hydroxy-3-cyclohexene-1-carboxylate synthase
MKQITNHSAAVKQITQLCCPTLIARLIPLLWRLVVAVRSFFRRRGLARIDGLLRATAGIGAA